MSNDTSIAMLRAPYLERRVDELTYVQLLTFDLATNINPTTFLFLI